MTHEKRETLVVAGEFSFVVEGSCGESGDDDEDGEEELGESREERRFDGVFDLVGGEGALDEYEVGTPVAEAEDEP